MISFYPGEKRRFQYRGCILKGMPKDYTEHAIASQIESGALDFLRLIAKEFTTREDAERYGIIVSLDVIALPVAEYEKIMMAAYEEGRRDMMRCR